MSVRPVLLRGARTPGRAHRIDVRLADGAVAAVAPTGGVEPRSGDEVVDARGAVVMPGLVDAHVHWSQWAQVRRRVDVGHARDPEEAATIVAAAGTPGLVVGHGFRAALWSRPPHRDMLERAAPGAAIALVSDDLHAVWLLADGSLNTRTAACHHAYPDPADGHGALNIDPGDLRELMVRVSRAGLHPAVHAIGDRANAVVLDAFTRVDGPGRIEHAQLVAPDDVPRFARPGLVASVQPAHLVDDRDVAERHWPEVTARAYPYADLVAAGARLELGSDAPVAAPDPWAAIAAAVARTGDDRPPWHPEQALDVATALRASCGGRLELRPGDLADVVLLEEDPLHADPATLREMPVRATLLAGRFTHRVG